MNRQEIAPKWAPGVFLAGLVGAAIIIYFFNFLPSWINMLPGAASLIGLLLSGIINKNMKPNLQGKIYFMLSIFSAVLVVFVLLLDSMLDSSCPVPMIAQVYGFHGANRSVSSQFLIKIIDPSGRVYDASVPASSFINRPPLGASGKAMTGNGLFGIQYIKSLEFDEPNN